MQQCSYCLETKDWNQFYVRSDTGKHTTECKACRSARSRARYLENTEHHAALVKRRYDAFGRFDRYGLTAETFAAMLESQGGKCALCETTEPGGKGKWSIDHEHEIGAGYHGFKAAGGEVRGLLCHRCNIALGGYEGLLQRVGRERVEKYRAR
jgi:hypothetical protein